MQFVLLVIDSTYVTIYCRDRENLESLYHNTKIKGFDNI
ncbi:DUF2691 family protein [Cytobacillus praedii]|nr:DUF2691 family protein [Cytobacillus praedii]